MSRAVARLILGLKPWHTRAAADSALKRLVTTVHPDVCHGPDAKRLTQLALDARSALLSVKPPRLFGVERGADGIWTMKIRSAIRPVVGACYLRAGPRSRFHSRVHPHRGDREPVGWFTCRAVNGGRRVGHLWRFDSGAFDYGLPGGRVPGLRAGAAHVVSDGAGGALCGFGGVDGVSTVSRGPRRSRGAPLGGAVRGVRRGDLDGAGQAVMPAVRRDADPDEGRRWSGTAIPCRTCCSSTATRRK